MIVRITYDVHGQDETEVLTKARDILATFTNHGEDYALHIEVFEESSMMGGAVALWRGEVRAEYQPP